MKYDCQMVQEIATFSDSGVILTRLDVSRPLDINSCIFSLDQAKEDERTNCYPGIIRSELRELIT
jgi:hypothetical protein